jgi:hypothetical protein
MMYCCGDVWLWWCIGVMMYCCDFVLLWWCIIVVTKCIVVIVYFCGHALLWWCFVAVMYGCDEVSLWLCKIIVIMYCCDDVLLSAFSKMSEFRLLNFLWPCNITIRICAISFQGTTRIFEYPPTASFGHIQSFFP